MTSAPNLSGGAVNACARDRRAEDFGRISRDMRKRSNLVYAHVASAVEKLACLRRREPCHVRRGLNVVEAHAASVTVGALSLRFLLLDSAEAVNEHRLTDQGNSIEFEPRIIRHGVAVRKHQPARVCEQRFDALVTPDLLDGDEGIFEIGHIPDIGKDKSKYLSSRVLRQDRHVSNRGALAHAAVSGFEVFVARSDVDETCESVGARCGAT